MPKFSLTALALLAGLFAAQSARADIIDTFDPSNPTNHGYWAVTDVGATTESITINILGYAFAPSALGTVYMNEEPPWTGIYASDSITVSNTGPSGWGVITAVSGDMPWATSGLCNGAADESVSPYCRLDLPLLNGPDLGVSFYSPAGDLPGSELSDVLRIDVPEPATMVLLGAGLLGLGLARRKRG